MLIAHYVCFVPVLYCLCEFGAFHAQAVTKICILMRKSISLVQVWAKSRTSGEDAQSFACGICAVAPHIPFFPRDLLTAFAHPASDRPHIPFFPWDLLTAFAHPAPPAAGFAQSLSLLCTSRCPSPGRPLQQGRPKLTLHFLYVKISLESKLSLIFIYKNQMTVSSGLPCCGKNGIRTREPL